MTAPFDTNNTWTGTNQFDGDLTVKTLIPYDEMGNPASAQGLQYKGNLIQFGNQYILQCVDPSALFVIPLTGTTTPGDIVTLHFLFSSNDYPVSYTVQSGDTLATVAAGLIAVIKADTNLYVPISARNPSGGGYPGQITNCDAVGDRLFIDYDITNPMTMTKSVSGAATEIVTLPNGGSSLPTALDANPVIDIQRIPGVAPSPQSNIGQFRFISSRSDSPVGANTVYTALNCTVKNSTAGSLTGQFEMIFPDGDGHYGNGWYFGGTLNSSGIFGVNTTGGNKGDDTINSQGFYVNGRSINESVETTISSGTDIVMSAANVVNGKITRQTKASAFDQWPTAADIVAALPTRKTGIDFDIVCINRMAGDWDIQANTGVNYGAASGHITIGPSNALTFKCHVNNVTPGSEQVTIYGAGDNYATRVRTITTTANVSYYPIMATSTTNGYQITNLCSNMSLNASTGVLNTTGGYSVGGTAGINASFTVGGVTYTFTKGILTSAV
jgi:hypothetical protein